MITIIVPRISMLRKRFSGYFRTTTEATIAPAKAKNGAIKTVGIKSKIFAIRRREIWK